MVERARIQDRNAQQAGNAPASRLAVGGIQGINKPNTNSGFRGGSGLEGALDALGARTAAMQQRTNDEDFVNGQLDYMAGKTEQDVLAEGNGTTTAGFLSLGITNKVADWQTAQAEEINTDTFSMDPEEYRRTLAEKTATMLEKVGDDPYARAAFAKAMATSQGKLASAQERANADYREQKTIGNYTESLMKHNNPDTPQSMDQAGDHNSLAFVKQKDWAGYAASLQARNAQIESSGGKNMSNDTTSAEGLHAFTDKRWIESVKRHRPDLAKGASNSELLALKFNNNLQKQLFIAEAARGAADLDASGFPVNPGTSYLQWFLGNGGVKRFLRADPNALISTAVNGESLVANRAVFRHDGGKGGYKTVAQVMAWANKKTGTNNGPVVEHVNNNPTAPANFSQWKYGTADLDGLTPQTKSRFSAMMDSAPAHIKAGLRIYSGYRSPPHQARIVADNMSKYGLGSKVGQWQEDVQNMGPVAAGKKWRPLMKSKGLTKWVAMPGGSRHQKGMAMDLKFHGKRLDKPEAKEAAEWVATNASKFGLKVPMEYEPWQLELDPEAKGTVAGPGTMGMGAGTSLLANPGLSPAKHRAATANAVIMSLGADQGGLYANIGGEAGLVQIGATPQQINAVRTAKRAFDKRKNNEYDAEYESAYNDFFDGMDEYDSDEEMRAGLRDFNEKYDKGSEAARQMHRLAESEFDKIGDLASKNALQQVPELMETVDEYRNDVATGALTAEEANDALQDLAEKENVDPASLAKAVKVMLDTKAKRTAAMEAKAQKEFTASQQAKAKEDTLKRAIASNSLKTLSAAEQQKGIELYRNTVAAQIENKHSNAHPLADQHTNPADHNNKLSDSMAKFLVTQDVVDKATASRMRVNLREPIGADGEITEEARSAFDFYMRLTGTHKATDSYMARMFKDDEQTLDLLRDAELIHGGDGDIDGSMMSAVKQRDNPDVAATVKKNVTALTSGDMVSTIKQDLIDDTGRTDTLWNDFINSFSRLDFVRGMITDEQQQFLMDDSGFTRAIDTAIRSQTMLYPTASQDSIRRRVMTQMQTGKFIGGSYIPGPAKGGASLETMMGLEGFDEGTVELSVMEHLVTHGEELFGADVWADIGPSFPFEYQGGTRFHTGNVRPEVHVTLVGKHFEITPRSSKYKIEDPAFGGLFSEGAFQSNPEAQIIRVPVRDIGDWYKNKETAKTPDSFTNFFVDLTQPLADAVDDGRAAADDFVKDNNLEAIFGSTEQ